ncbi:MAG: 2-C-methyl-D-erythritol 4-phosphate cytidylyltransferase [Syntrophomonadaceae bacterium]|nr:2-C-methyl-D-erythritol 4-phosphate cytidylyltransferase [Syntrophomonadaceae bacterium]
MANNLRVVIAAAGTGSRMKSNINKQYMLLKGKPVLYYSLQTFNSSDLVDEIVVVAHPDEVDYCWENVVKKYQFTKVKKIIPGGRERQDSVVQGLKNLNADTDLVAVHDGARPLLPSGLIHEIYIEAKKHGAAIPGVPVTDTIKMVDKDGLVSATLDRSSIMAVQTPQIFAYGKLLKAYELAFRDNFIGTDDASLYEKYIGQVKLVLGDPNNIKITTPKDLIIAEQLLG